MTTTAEAMRAWTGPAVLTYGFRPLFLGAGIWAAMAMALWLAMLAGWPVLPTAFDPVSWHAHEFLFGFLGAVAAGFLLTAVPNWTGRLPIVGWPLAALFVLWLIGRIAVATSVHWPAVATAAADLAFPVALALALLREIVAGRNWRNLVVLGLLAVLIGGNAVFHWQAAKGDYAAGGAGLRIGLAAAVLMIVVIGGRIVPSFTRNWLARQGNPARPATPGHLDRGAVAAMAAALALWVALPEAGITGAALVLAGLGQAARLARWCGHRSLAEPLLWILHAGYALVPIGALALGGSILWPGAVGVAAAQHLWMAGAVGTMTLAVMTRATLGHTGQALTAGRGTTAVYACVLASVALRVWAGTAPALAPTLHTLSGLAWIAAFTGFALAYGPALLRARRPG